MVFTNELSHEIKNTNGDIVEYSLLIGWSIEHVPKLNLGLGITFN